LILDTPFSRSFLFPNGSQVFFSNLILPRVMFFYQ
jgi:hypothetical protein